MPKSPDARTLSAPSRDTRVGSEGWLSAFSTQGGALRGWALWSLPRRARRYVLLVDAMALLALLAALHSAPCRLPDLGVFAAFVLCGLVSVEGSRHLGSPQSRRDRAYKDLLTAWTLPVALLLPPVYATLVYLPIIGYAQVRVAQQPPVKRSFNIATVMLAGFLASSAHELMMGEAPPYSTTELVGTPHAMLAAVAAAIVFAMVSAGLVAGVLYRITPGAGRRRALGSRDDMVIDAADLCLGLLVAVIWTASPAFVGIALLPVLLLQRTLLHGELLQASRTDAKTGLANPAHWRDVAEREVARALRGGQSLAVLLVDLDHFKVVNDTVGHLAGDTVLAAVAQALREAVRPRDLVGRFGGEEFAVLLTEVDAEAAERTAERMREQVQRLRCPVGERRPPVTVTVSVGISLLDADTADLTGLLDASDAALYRAKASGRNRVFRGPARPAPPMAGPNGPDSDRTALI
ncbi:MAG: GGDEF domain-containing protein [Frankiaceae bacterium]